MRVAQRTGDGVVGQGLVDVDLDAYQRTYINRRTGIMQHKKTYRGRYPRRHQGRTQSQGSSSHRQ